MTRPLDKSSKPKAGSLFSLDACRARPSMTSRLLALSEIPPVPPGELMRRREEDDQTMERLRLWGQELGKPFKLRYRILEPERPGVTDWYGVCYDDGEIRIRLRHATTGRLLKESSLVDTLCHELAHLRYMDHSLRFQKLYRRILERARLDGIYRPGPDPRAPLQLDLFDGACATGMRRGKPRSVRG